MDWKTFRDWAPVIVPLLVVVVTIINAWVLKLYELNKQKESKNNPKSSGDNKYLNRLIIFDITMAVLLVVTAIQNIHSLIDKPTLKPNSDALRIAINVAEILFACVMLFHIWTLKMLGNAIHRLSKTIRQMSVLVINLKATTEDMKIFKLEATKILEPEPTKKKSRNNK